MLIAKQNRRPYRFKYSGVGIILSLFVLLSFSAAAQTLRLDSLLTPQEISWLNEHKDNIRYAPDPSWPPADYTEDGVHKGFVSDYIKLFEAMLGIQFDRVYYKTWSEVLNALKNSEADLVGAIQQSEERDEYLLFTDPYIQVEIGIATKATYKQELTKKHINTMRLACIRDYESTQYIEKEFPDAQIVLVNNVLDAMLQTSYGLVDGAVVDFMSASYLVDNYGITNLKNAAVLNYFWDIGFASRKELPELNSIINKVLKTIDEEQHQIIFKRWVNYTTLSEPNFFEKHQKVIIAILLLILLSFIVISIFGVLLKKQINKQTLQLRDARDVAESSEERYRLIAENTSDMIWLSDLHFNLTYVSPSVERMFGFKPEDYLIISLEDKIPLQYHVIFRQFFKEELEREMLPDQNKTRSRIMELEHYHKDGSKFWVSMNVSFVRDESGKPIGLHGVTRNVDAIKKASEYIEKRLAIETLLSKTSRLAIANSELDAVFDAILEETGTTFNLCRVYILEYDSLHNTVSNTFEWCTEGVTPLMENFRQFCSAEDCWIIDSLKQGKIMEYKDIEEIPDASTIAFLRLQGIISMLNVPLMLNDRFYGFIGFDECKTHRAWQSEDVKALESLAYIVTSLLERDITEKELIKKDRSIELSLVGKVFASLDGKITYVNQTFLTYWGNKKLEDIQDKTVYEFLESKTEVQKILTAVEKEGFWQGESKAKRSDGSLFDVLINANMVTSHDGNPLCIQASIYDITERKAREQELILVREKAEESNRLKSAFLVNISHEIRTPMNGILGFLNILKDMKLSDQEKEDYIGLVNKSGKRLLDTVNDIIEISEIESGEIDIQESETTIAETLEFIKSVYKPLAIEKNLQFRMNKVIEISNVKFLTDKIRLVSILSNLIKNAIKFTEKGSVELGADIAEHLVRFYVKDTGKGIPKDRVELIFDRFVQADLNLSREHEGAGLGLSIARAYVGQLGGKIWVESKMGHGSTFHVTIPFKPV